MNQKPVTIEQNVIGIFVLAIIGFIILFFWLMIKYGGWPAIFVLLALPVGGIAAFSENKFAKGIGSTLLAFAIGMAPHVIFLCFYNGAIDNLVANTDTGLRPEPDLFPIANLYEHFVVSIYQLTSGLLDGWRLYIFLICGAVLIVVLSIYRPAAAKGAIAARAAFGIFQIVLAGSVAVTVLSNSPIRDWTADYRPRLQARLAALDKMEVKALLLEKIGHEAEREHVAIKSAYGPTIIAAAESLYPGGTSKLPVEDRSRMPVERLLARIRVQPFLTQELDAEAGEFGDAYATHVQGLMPSVARYIAPGDAVVELKEVSRPKADRLKIIALDQQIDDTKQRAEQIGNVCVSSVADAIADIKSGYGPVLDTFASALISNAFELVFDRIERDWRTDFGRGVAQWLRERDDRTDHPISSSLLAHLVPPVLAPERGEFAPEKVRIRLNAFRVRKSASAAEDLKRKDAEEKSRREMRAAEEKIIQEEVRKYSPEEHPVE